MRVFLKKAEIHFSLVKMAALGIALSITMGLGAQESSGSNCRKSGTSGTSQISQLAKALQEIDNSSCPVEGNAINVKNTLDFLSMETALTDLKKGATLNHLVFLKNAAKLSEQESAIVKTIAPLTSFANEQEENNVTVPDLTNPGVMGNFKTIISKNMFIIPGVTAKDITPELVASYDYQNSCQPGIKKGKTVVEKSDVPNTFRIEKEVLKIMFKSIKINIQMKTSELTDKVQSENIAALDGLPADKIILLERTKKNKNKEDGTKIAKNVLVYRNIKGGVLVTLYTVILNNQIPTAFSLIASKFGSDDAANENNETAVNTRIFFKEKAKDKK